VTLPLARQRYLPPGLGQPRELPDPGGSFWGRIFRRLWQAWGDPHWWPGRDAWEVAAGAILTQNTAWSNVERALANLREAGITTPRAVLEAGGEELAVAIRPSGYFNVKAKKLAVLARWWIEEVESGQVDRLEDGVLREELLSLWGVGPETADAIACYALGRPLFVVDAYTTRTLARLRGLEVRPGYGEVQEEVHEQLPRHTLLFNHLHGLLVVLGKEHCTARSPRCEPCPLLAMCSFGRQRTEKERAR
jgi:endonuclease-3 related protein